MDKRISTVREKLAAARKSPAKEYSPELRAEVVALGKAWFRKGGKRVDLIRKLDMSAATFDIWFKRAHQTQRAAVRPVTVVDEPGPGFVAELADGVRIEGLSLSDVIELARGLRC